MQQLKCLVSQQQLEIRKQALDSGNQALKLTQLVSQQQQEIAALRSKAFTHCSRVVPWQPGIPCGGPCLSWAPSIERILMCKTHTHTDTS